MFCRIAVKGLQSLGLMHFGRRKTFVLGKSQSLIGRPPPPKSAELQNAKLIRGARIETTRGTIRLALLPDLAPMAVNSFAHLAEKGFYNGIIL